MTDPAVEPTAVALTARRAETVARVEMLEREVDGVVRASEMSNADDEHDPEGATIAFERAQVLTLLREAKAELTDLDAAADRVAHGSYGVCEGCGADIPAERLAARPGARTCVGCAERRR